MEKELPRILLGRFPTPVHRLEHMGCDRLWIKRDDLSSQQYGGNKVRKLEFLLADAKRKNKQRVVTFGGLGTNHGLATAVFCHLKGLKCTLILFDQPVTCHVKQNLRLFHSYDAELCPKGSFAAALFSFFLLKRLTDPRAYFIYPGGSSVLGTMGFVNAALELKTQVDAGLIPEPAVIFCPVGSGGTQAGLMVGFWLAKMRTSVVGVRVTYDRLGPIPICNEKTVARLIEKTAAFLRKRLTGLPGTPILKPSIMDEYVGKGYGYPTAAGARAMALMKEKQNIGLDPCYSAKTFAAVLDYCRQSSAKDGPVLFWHTCNAVDLCAQAEAVSPARFSTKVGEALLQPEITADP